jgi:hypothetical protein
MAEACPGDGGRQTNREIFRILNNRNMLSARQLQKAAETSIYKNAEIGKAEMSSKNLIFVGGQSGRGGLKIKWRGRAGCGKK